MVPTQTYIVTGGNSGLGFECASALAKDSSTLVIIACRNALQGEQAAQRVRAAGGNVDVLPLDLAKQASVRRFVETFRKRRFPPLVGVVCNAGMQNVGAPDRAPDGTENRPDVSVGKCFSDWLKKHHPNISTAFSYYIHKTPEWEGEARQYPFSALPLFREYLDTVWIPERAPDYLKTRDPAALPYLQKLLPSPNKPRAGMIKSLMIRRKAG